MIEFARRHDLLVVHDNAYSELTYDGYVAPSFLATPGAMEVGVEVFSLSKSYNMTGWRCGAILGNEEAVTRYWRLKTNVDSGLFEAVQLAGAAALTAPRTPWREMCALYQRRRDLVLGALRDIGDRPRSSAGDDLRLGSGSGGPHVGVVRRGGAGTRGRGDQPRLRLRAQRRGLLPDLAHRFRRPARRGRRADACCRALGPAITLDPVGGVSDSRLLKPGHDGADRRHQDRKLLFSLEAEKDSFRRYSLLNPTTILTRSSGWGRCRTCSGSAAGTRGPSRQNEVCGAGYSGAARGGGAAGTRSSGSDVKCSRHRTCARTSGWAPAWPRPTTPSSGRCWSGRAVEGSFYLLDDAGTSCGRSRCCTGPATAMRWCSGSRTRRSPRSGVRAPAATAAS